MPSLQLELLQQQGSEGNSMGSGHNAGQMNQSPGHPWEGADIEDIQS